MSEEHLSTMASRPIPKLVDSPIQLFFWEADELVPMIVFIYLSMLFKTWLLLPVALIVHHVVVKKKSRANRGILQHWAYAKGLPVGFPYRPVSAQQSFYGEK